MEYLNQCSVKCCYCKLSKMRDFGWSEDWQCTVGVLDESVGWHQEGFDCEKFEAKFDIVKSEHGLAKFDLEENKFLTPWVDYANKKLTCPKCQSIDWAVEEGIDWGEEVCRNCGFTSMFLSHSNLSPIMEYILEDTFMESWQGDNTICR